MKVLGAKFTKEKNIELNGIIIHRREKEISFPARLNMWEGVLELITCTPGGRDHESLLKCEVDPIHLQLMLTLLGARNGSSYPKSEVRPGTAFAIEVDPGSGSRIPVEKWIVEDKTESRMKKQKWIFVGTGFDSNGNCLARQDGNLIDINSMDKNTIIKPETSKYIEDGLFSANKDRILSTVKRYSIGYKPEDYSIPVRVYLIPEEGFDIINLKEINEKLKNRGKSSTRRRRKNKRQ